MQLCFAPGNLKSSKPYRNQLLRLFIHGIADVDTFSQLTHTHSHTYIYRDVYVSAQANEEEVSCRMHTYTIRWKPYNKYNNNKFVLQQ